MKKKFHLEGLQWVHQECPLLADLRWAFLMDHLLLDIALQDHLGLDPLLPGSDPRHLGLDHLLLDLDLHHLGLDLLLLDLDLLLQVMVHRQGSVLLPGIDHRHLDMVHLLGMHLLHQATVLLHLTHLGPPLDMHRLHLLLLAHLITLKKILMNSKTTK